MYNKLTGIVQKTRSNQESKSDKQVRQEAGKNPELWKNRYSPWKRQQIQKHKKRLKYELANNEGNTQTLEREA